LRDIVHPALGLKLPAITQPMGRGLHGNGSVSVALLNVADHSATVSLSSSVGGPMEATPRYEWVFTASM
jgi:hypothetical protein